MATETAIRTRGTRPPFRLSEQATVGLISVVTLLLLWEIITRLNWANPTYVSAPSRVLTAGWVFVSSGEIWSHAWVSLLEFVVGFAGALAFGVVVGLLLGYYQPLRLLFDPIVMGLNATPRVALYPIIAVWLGIGILAKSSLVFLGAVVPIIVNTMAGLQTVDSTLLRVARSFGAGEWTIFFRILLPSSLPAVLAGVRLGLGRAVISVIVAEMFSSLQGIGHLLMAAGAGARADQIFFLVVLTAAFGYLMITVVQRLEERVSAWSD